MAIKLFYIGIEVIKNRCSQLFSLNRNVQKKKCRIIQEKEKHRVTHTHKTNCNISGLKELFITISFLFLMQRQ